MQGRLHGVEAGGSEVIVDFLDLSYRVFLELLEAYFVEMAVWDQGAILKEGIVHDLVASDQPLINVLYIGTLQAHGAQTHLSLSLRRPEHNIRIAMDMDEARVREHFEKQFDATGVRRRFEEQGEIPFPSQFLVEERQCRRPFCDLTLGYVPKGEVLVVLFPGPRKDPGQERRMQRTAGCKLVFERYPCVEMHIVHHPRFW